MMEKFQPTLRVIYAALQDKRVMMMIVTAEGLYVLWALWHSQWIAAGVCSIFWMADICRAWRSHYRRGTVRPHKRP